MVRNPKVSIVIPVYNCESYIGEMLDSLLNQTMQDFEVICVNDGSTDESLGILELYAKRDDRIRVLSQENAGEGAARNTGLRIASGDLVICVDADDICEQDMLELMVRPFDSPEIGLVFCATDDYFDDTNTFKLTTWVVDERHIPSRKAFDPREADNLYRWVVGFIANKMIRRSILVDQGLYCQEIRTHGDLSFAYTALSVASKIYYVDKILYHHRKRSDGTSLSDTTQDSMYECVFLALAELKSNLQKAGVWADFERAFVNYALYMCNWKYNRVSAAAKMKVHDALRDRWFRELGVSGYPSEFYFDESEYRFMVRTLEHNYVDAQIIKIGALEKKLSDTRRKVKDTRKKISAIRRSRSYKMGNSLLRVPRKMKKIISK